MLSNAYSLVKFRFDTAENEPAKKFAKNFPEPAMVRRTTRPQVAATKDWVQKALQDHEGVLVGGVAAQPGYVVDDEGVGELLCLF